MRIKGFIFLLIAALVYWGMFFLGIIRDRDASSSGDAAPAAEVSYTAGALAAVESAVEMFKLIEGRYPDSLEELVEEGYMRALPVLPEGLPEYDPSDGTVR